MHISTKKLGSYNCLFLLRIEEDTENGMVLNLILSCSFASHHLLHPSPLPVTYQAQTILLQRGMELKARRMKPFQVSLEAQ